MLGEAWEQLQVRFWISSVCKQQILNRFLRLLLWSDEVPTLFLTERRWDRLNYLSWKSIEYRCLFICFFIAIFLAIQPLDRVWRNRSRWESVFAGFIAGAIILAKFEHQGGQRQLLMYSDRVRIRHLSGNWPLRYVFGKTEWKLSDIDQIRVALADEAAKPCCEIVPKIGSIFRMGLTDDFAADQLYSAAESMGITVSYCEPRFIRG